ncbi:DUF4262 domain-containing protein [bacterium]|nr:DUF4262 domain-containing protein [bacterium]
MEEGNEDSKVLPFTHKKECPCEICNGTSFEEIEKQQEQYLKDCGFYVHYVPGEDEDSPTGVNIHTHGIQESFDHPDFQIVMMVSMEAVHSIFHYMVSKIKKGVKYEPGKIYKDVVPNDLPIAFKWTTESDSSRNVLRMIVCDPVGEIEEDKMQEPYNHQYCGTSEEPIL